LTRYYNSYTINGFKQIKPIQSNGNNMIKLGTLMVKNNIEFQMFFKVFLTKSYVAKLIPVAIGPLIQFILRPLKNPCLMPSVLD